MTDEILTADICVIGGGSGGLSVAAGASQLGKRTILVEGGKMGGDCLNYGCVPSKSIIAAANNAHIIRSSSSFGVLATEPEINFSKVHDHVHDVIASIAPHDSVERFEKLGVKVIQDYGTFEDQNTLRAGSQLIKAKRFIIATGSSPSVPPIPGLSDVAYLTNETIFDLKNAPDHLIIIGGGPIGLEMAQAYRRLGAKVTVIALAFMENEDPELVSILLETLQDEGITLKDNVTIQNISHKNDTFTINLENERIQGTHLLVATGRSPNIENLNLEKANVAYSKLGIKVGQNLRTTNKAIYAIGDVTGGVGFTHKAGYDAGIIIRRIIFGMFWAKTNYKALPHVTYTSPELASVGLSEKDARNQYGNRIKILTSNYSENDRARAERATIGMIKVITTIKGKILGVSIVGKNAGDILSPWCLALNEGLKIGSMANIISPYPTLGEINKRVASSFYTEKLFSEKTKKIVKFLSKLG